MEYSVQELRSVFSYCADTGKISRRNPAPWVDVAADRPRKANRQCLSVCFKRKKFLSHRVAWALHFGDWPNGDIDHINGDESDNRIVNLRVVSKSVNQQNKRRPRADNKSGFLGVRRHGQVDKWVAQITISGKTVYLGTFDDPKDAHSAYLAAKRAMHPGCTI